MAPARAPWTPRPSRRLPQPSPATGSSWVSRDPPPPTRSPRPARPGASDSAPAPSAPRGPSTPTGPDEPAGARAPPGTAPRARPGVEVTARPREAGTAEAGSDRAAGEEDAQARAGAGPAVQTQRAAELAHPLAQQVEPGLPASGGAPGIDAAAVVAHVHLDLPLVHG